MFRGPSFIVSTMQEETTPIFKHLWYDWTQQQPGIEPTNPLGQCWVPPIVAFYDQQGILRTYSLPGSSIRSSHPGSPRELSQKAFAGIVSNCMRGTTVQQRELLEAVHSILHFRHYLESRHFQLYTDHAALIPLLTKKDNQHRWACWALDIQQFSFTTHVAGKSILMNGPDVVQTSLP